MITPNSFAGCWEAGKQSKRIKFSAGSGSFVIGFHILFSKYAEGQNGEERVCLKNFYQSANDFDAIGICKIYTAHSCR